VKLIKINVSNKSAAKNIFLAYCIDFNPERDEITKSSKLMKIADKLTL